MQLIRSVSGVRGIVRADGGETITMGRDVARRLGQAYATHLRNNVDETRPLVLVGGRDGRRGGDELLTAFADGVRSCGVHLIDIGIVTTPGVAMTVKAVSAIGGVVITASHNPDQWNGIKLMTAEGQAPTSAAAKSIYALFDSGDFRDDSLSAKSEPRALDPHAHHVDAVLRIVDVQKIRSRNYAVVLDSINGAGANAGRLLLDRLGCRVIHINNEPAERFAHTPEPVESNLGDLCRRVQSEHVDVGFAQDPDADRVAVIDENGRFIGEEYTLALCATRVFATRPGPAAANLSTSRLIDDLAAAAGPPCCVHRSAVGEANVVEAMRAHDCVFGGEGNGGVIDPRVVYVRDSLVGIALVLDVMAADGGKPSDIVAAIGGYAMLKEKIECDQSQIQSALAAVREAFDGESINDIDGIRVDWPNQRKWVHVRGSNTEPIMRVIVEAVDAQSASALMDSVRAIIGRP